MPRELTKREQWLMDRIGRIVYRPKTNCTCDICNQVYLHGVMIADKDHAQYLSEMEIEYTLDGTPMEYFDTRQEAIDFENENRSLE